MRKTSTLLVGLLAAIAAYAQFPPPTIIPEDGFLSSDKYVNAFFGFAIPLPQVEAAQPMDPRPTRSGQVLFGMFSYRHTFSLLLVTAKEANPASSDQARKAAEESTSGKAKPLVISGQPFWKGETDEKRSVGTMKTVIYTTALRGHILTFTAAGVEANVRRQLQQAIESVTFFDPAAAREVAGTNSRPYRVLAPSVPSKRINYLNPGTLVGNLYKNEDLGFSYELPAGWHAADKETVLEAGHKAIWGSEPAARREHEQAAHCIRVLLYAERHPAGTPKNPAIMILAFDPACAPGAPRFPASPQDEEGISRVGGAILQSLMTQRGFRPIKQTSVRVLTAQNHLLIEIPGEYSMRLPGENLAVRVSVSLVFMELNDYWVAIQFMSSTEAGVRKLMKEATLSFAPSAAPSAPSR